MLPDTHSFNTTDTALLPNPAGCKTSLLSLNSENLQLVGKGKICPILLLCVRPFSNKHVAEEVEFVAQSTTLTFAGNKALLRSSSTTTHGVIYCWGSLILC